MDVLYYLISSTMSANDHVIWECPVCVYTNESTRDSCDLCGTTRAKIAATNDLNKDRDINPYTNTQLKTSPNSTHTTSNDPSDAGDEYGNSDQLQVVMKISRPPTPSQLQLIKSRFERATMAIGTGNHDSLAVLKTLKSVCRKTLKDDDKYRTLDLQNPRVVERLITFQYVPNFLYELGFKLNEPEGIKLICHVKPSVQVIETAVYILNSFMHRYDADKIRRVRDVDKNKNKFVWNLEQIVGWCTDEAAVMDEDTDSMHTVIVTHKDYCKSIDLLNAFRNRYFISAPEDIKNDKEKEKEKDKDKDKLVKWENDICKRIRLKVINGLKDWLILYWNEDFENNSDNIKDELLKFINEIKSKTPDLPIGELLEIQVEKFSKNSNDGGINNINYNTNIRPKLHPFAFDCYEINWDSITYDKRKNENNCQFISPIILADQITLLDFDIFRKIKARECIGQAWKKKNCLQRAPNVVKMISQFNCLTKFCQIQILSQNSVINRACAISKVFEMGRRFYQLNNMNSLCAVFSSLDTIPWYTIENEWAEISPEDKQFLTKFKLKVNTIFFQRFIETPAIPNVGAVLRSIQDANRSFSFTMYPRIMDEIKFLQTFQKDGYESFDNYNNDNIDANGEKQEKKDEKELEQKDCDTNQSVEKHINLKPDLKIMKMLMDQFEIAKKFSKDEIHNMINSLKCD